MNQTLHIWVIYNCSYDKLYYYTGKLSFVFAILITVCLFCTKYLMTRIYTPSHTRNFSLKKKYFQRYYNYKLMYITISSTNTF